jgi:hypothetical protein
MLPAGLYALDETSTLPASGNDKRQLWPQKDD